MVASQIHASKCLARDKRCVKCVLSDILESIVKNKKKQFSDYRTETVHKKPRRETKNDTDKSDIDYIFHFDDNETMNYNTTKKVTLEE